MTDDERAVEAKLMADMIIGRTSASALSAAKKAREMINTMVPLAAEIDEGNEK